MRLGHYTHPLKTKKSSSDVITSKLGKCTVTATTKITPTSWKHPNVTWDLETEVRIDCPCDGKGSKSLKYANFLITAKVDGFINTTTGNFKKLKDPKVELRSVICCSSKKKKKPKETSIGLSDTLGEGIISDTFPITPLPNQTIGVTAGIGFSNDFEETNVCFGAEYLYNLVDVGESSLFVGANVIIENNSINDFNNTWVGVGPTAQLFTPINPAKDVHITNGVSGGYLFGTTDNNGSKDDISGFEISLNTGLNVPLSEDIALSVIVPLVTHTSLELTSQEGNGSVKRNSTDIFFFKNSPVKFGVRVDIGN